MNSELTAIDWLGRGWLLLLAFTVAGSLVAALRKPCRHLFGTERAFQLWLLPPLAMLATQLPHPAHASFATLPAVVYMITSVGGVLSVHAGASTGMSWRTGTVLVWFTGALASLVLATWAQWRYRRHLLGATRIIGLSSRWPVLRANRTDVGPALVGAWHSRIVLPADFEHRYDVTERVLILTHETTHARRHDGYWCLLAQVVATLFWFHPLAWWALSALRHDQELACDAAVLQQYGEQRHSYAHAMLKTQSALFALPVGCPWSPRHPLTERIAMLKLPQPNRARRSTGMIAGFVLAMLVAGSVYAASKPAGPHAATTTSTHEYQLSMMLELTSNDAHASHVERTTLALCLAPGKQGTVSTHGWSLEATTFPDGENRVRVDLAVTNDGSGPMAHTQVHGALGESLRAEGKGDDGIHQYAIDVTPLAGCPARVGSADSGARLPLVSQVAKNESARAVAVSVAAKAGLTLVNPESLDSRLVTLNFEQIPAERAMYLIADIDGKKAVFDGKHVQFVPK